MLKSIIFEGASTSGKTTLIERLGTMLSHAHRVNEDLTLFPFLEKPALTHFQHHLRAVVEAAQACGEGVVLYDRLHITAAAVTNEAQASVRDFERWLLQFDPLLVFLEIQEDSFKARLARARAHRGPSWTVDMQGKGGTEDAVAAWYAGTQRKLLHYLEGSLLPILRFDATESRYDDIAAELLAAQ